MAAEPQQNACLAVSAFRAFTGVNGDTTQRLRQGCREAFKPHVLIKPLDYDNDIEKAGSIFADVVFILDGVASISEAVKGATAMNGFLGKFATKNVATAELKSGYYLEAQGSEGIVRIYRDLGDGKPGPIATELEKNTLKRSTQQAGKCGTGDSPILILL